ncbi:MAG: hypothetical protein A2Z34_03895 [Planctomycetes bacterium RBG_16_59_8]|nr:MAG: hypothetical protein A2Z34_03895 [Planctomycetes bacterium RBG_16_59_8]
MDGDIADGSFVIQEGGFWQIIPTDRDGDAIGVEYAPGDRRTSIAADIFNFADLLPPGQYTLDIRAGGFQSKRVFFTIEEGKTTQTNVVLDPE